MRSTAWTVLTAVAPLALLTACADPAGSPAPSGADDDAAGDDAGGTGAAAGGISQADNDLQVTFDPGDGSAPQTWTLTCVGFVEGTHPEPQATCDHLAGLTDPFAPLPDDIMCTEQYGGPQTATVIGLWAGQPVDLALSRVDGCRISQWDSLVPLVPAVEAAELLD